MKRIQTLIIFSLILLSSLVSSSILAEENQSNLKSINSDQYEQGYRYNVQGWIYLHIEGDPYERGYQHGYLLSSEIVDMINRWSNIIHNYKTIDRIGKHFSESRYKKVAETWWDFCTNQNFRMYWDKFPEEYKSEIKGIADGVTARGGKVHGRDVTFKDILAINEMYEFMSKLTRMRKGIHPLRTFFHQLEQIEPGVSNTGLSDFIESFLGSEPAHHCNGFIATGDATTNGQMVVSHTTICGGGAWWWTYYISLRWNVILDIQPTTGNRVIISTSPGLIWSDEDYYQNDNGIVFIETTCPQGLFDNKGLPLSVRARNAIQYGNSIDDVIYHLKYKNDGSMNAVWLIGDSKTGEISRFELGYRTSAVWRTFNGFYWSANNPIDSRVSLEKFYLKKYLKAVIFKIVLKSTGLGYNSIRYIPVPRDIKFEELGNKYYGQIDVDVVKEIMSTSPIVDYITDIKVTDSKMLEQNGLWAFFGNPAKILNVTNHDTKDNKIQRVHPTGWVRLFGVPSKENFNLIKQFNDYGEEADILWEFDTGTNANDFYSSGVTNQDTLYSTTSSGMIYSIGAKNGDLNWSKYIGEKPTPPVIDGDLLIIGHSEGLSALDLNGTSKWDVSTDTIVSKPVVVDNTVIFGDKIGNVFSISTIDKKEQWNLNFSDEIYIASSYDDNIYLTSGNSCYAIDSDDGEVMWEFDVNGMITSAPVLSDDMIYFGSWDNYVYALDASTGDLKWKYEAGWGFDTSPTVYNGLVFIGSNDNNFYALNAESGTLEWFFTCKAGIHSLPVVYGEYVFFGSDDGRFYALNNSNGQPAWFFAPGFTVDEDVYNYITTPIVSDPVVNDGTAYIGANGTVYALNANTFESFANPEEFIVPEDVTQDSFEGFTASSIIIVIIVALVVIFSLFWIKKRN